MSGVSKGDQHNTAGAGSYTIGGGGASGGGGGGGGGRGFSMMDGYANLLFTTSLATHRDGIVDPNDSSAYADNETAGIDLPAMPKVGIDTRILHWEP